MKNPIQQIMTRPKNREVVKYARELAISCDVDVDDLYKKFGREIVERSFEIQVIADEVNKERENMLTGLPLFEHGS